ncbi:hypothetical protein [Lacisediminihabitans sp.]|uniref:hypothetical protein n=1 Tax=Lacisediminihabitans sp. TaxID=2787631 RepID=UPI00374D2806
MGTVVAAPILVAEPASAAAASDWNPGYIVSDANFYDGTALSAPGVQNFLQTRNSGCSTGWVCILNYTQDTPSMPGTAYCSPMTGNSGESAASIIARVGAACNISQKTLLVLLEKEQGLISSHSPSASAWAHATGFNCPDTAPCNPAYAGFFYQVYYGARQLQVYRAFPGSFNYKARAVNNILYSPNSACGSSPVYIANDATAALYIYTPYQPNAAALANMYGIGDGCSSYGNRNFWRLWSDWFGSPTGPPIVLAQLTGTSNVYLVASGRRYLFPSADMLAQYASFGSPVAMTQTQLNSYPDGGAVQRGLVSTDGSAWLIDGGWRFHFVSCQQIVDFGMSCVGLPVISSSILNSKLVSAGDLRSLVMLPDRSKWLMQNGVRHEVPDPSVLAPYGIGPQVSGLTNFSIGPLQLGPPMVGPGLFTNGAGNFSTVGGNGLTYTLPPGSAAGSLGSSAYRIQPESYVRLPSITGVLPTRVASNGRTFILSDGGWLEVAASTYGGTSRFTAMPSLAWTGLPVASQQFGAHFIRERSNAQIMLASGGYIQPVATSSVSWLASTFGVNPTIWLAANGGLAGIDSMFPQPYTLVRVTGTQDQYLVAGAQRYPIPAGLVSLYAPLGPVQDITQAQLDAYSQRPAAQRAVKVTDTSSYLIDSGKRYRFTGCAQVADFGMNCDQLPLVDLAQLSKLGNGGTLQALSQLADGSVWLMQGGQRRQTPDASVLAPFGIPSTTTVVSNELLAGRPVGPPVLGAGPVTDGLSHYRAVGGAGAFDLAPAAVAGTVGSKAKSLQPASFALVPSKGTMPLRATADGRFFVSIDGGWLEVSAGTYGAQSVFTAVPSQAWTGLSVVGSQFSPHFVRERSSQQVFLASGGSLSKVPNVDTLNWIVRTYGVASYVWVASDGALAGLNIIG